MISSLSTAIFKKHAASVACYIKVLYIGKRLKCIKMKLSSLCKEYYKNKINIKVVFTSFKIKSLTPDDLQYFLVYEFTCGDCIPSYIG